MLTEEFQLPIAFDLTATFLFAVTGALAGMRRHYDIIGVFVLAFATALGGGLIRDGIFFSGGPPVAITTGYYLPVVAAAVIGTVLLGQHLVPPEKPIVTLVPASDADAAATLAKGKRLSVGEARESNRQNLLDHFNVEDSLARTYVTVLSLVDALGLGIYAVIGAQKSLNFGLPLTAAVLVGAVNAAGGGLLRDVLTREVPLLFKPGQFYALTAVIGAVVFVALTRLEQMNVERAALVAIAATFVLRALAIRFDWRTRPLVWEEQR